MSAREELLRQWNQLAEDWPPDYLAEMIQDVKDQLEREREIVDEQD